MAEKIKDVREVVDSADGGDYNATKEAKEQMEARIEFLSHTLDRAVIVEAPHDGSVGVGSLVEICYQGDDSTSTYLFGSIEERHDGTVDLSPNSPLGVALGGAKAGDTVSFTNPAGQEVSVDVVNVD